MHDVVAFTVNLQLWQSGPLEESTENDTRQSSPSQEHEFKRCPSQVGLHSSTGAGEVVVKEDVSVQRERAARNEMTSFIGNLP